MSSSRRPRMNRRRGKAALPLSSTKGQVRSWPFFYVARLGLRPFAGGAVRPSRRHRAQHPRGGGFRRGGALFRQWPASAGPRLRHAAEGPQRPFAGDPLHACARRPLRHRRFRTAERPAGDGDAVGSGFRRARDI